MGDRGTVGTRVRRAKGWADARPWRVRATHYREPEKFFAYCGAPIRVTEEEAAALAPAVGRALRRLEICDHCQAVLRRARRR